MNTENNANNATTENAAAAPEAGKTSFFGKVKSTLTSQGFKRTLATTAGVGAGLAITASSPRASNTSMAIAAGAGAIRISNAHKNDVLDQHFENGFTALAVMAGSSAIETTIIGAIANRLAPNAEFKNQGNETNSMGELSEPSAVPETKRSTIIDMAKSIFKPKVAETSAGETVAETVAAVKETVTTEGPAQTVTG